MITVQTVTEHVFIKIKILCTLMTRFMGPTWGPLRPTGPRWPPCWSHGLGYLGYLSRVMSRNEYIDQLRWNHALWLSRFHTTYLSILFFMRITSHQYEIDGTNKGSYLWEFLKRTIIVSLISPELNGRHFCNEWNICIVIEFHWILLLRFQLTICQDWFR